LFWRGKICAMKANFDAVLARYFGARFFVIRRRRKAIKNDPASFGRKSIRDCKAEACG
jgi:hypothetical protein